MNENPKETFLTAIQTKHGFLDDDEEVEIDVKSSTSSTDDILRTNTEIEQIFDKRDSYVSIPRVQSVDGIENPM